MNVLLRAIRMGLLLPWVGAVLLLGLRSGADWPPLTDVVARLRAEVPEVPEPSSLALGVEEYLRSLAPRVLMGGVAATNSPGLLRARTYHQTVGIAYLRVGEVQPGLRSAMKGALDGLAKTNAYAGIVLDLRFAEGTHYEAAVEAAGLFAQVKTNEFRLGESRWVIEPVSEARDLPVMVLVNRETRGAAEALAAAVRFSAGTSLVIGTNTAGQARNYRGLVLPGGNTLRIAAAPLLMPDARPFPLTGLEPDLSVAVLPADERAYWTDEFQRWVDGRPVGQGVTMRMNEAELVRRRQAREGLDELGRPGQGLRGPRRPGRLRAEPAPAPEGPLVVQDPVLARALDLIAGISSNSSSATDGETR